MIKEEIVLKNETGLHARPASLFVKGASSFVSNIKVIKDKKEYNAKSIIGILSMGAKKGDMITVKAEGIDEQKAVESLINLIKNDFKE